MNEAARAALDACGGHLKENPGHTERSSSFKRRNKPINHLDQADTNGGDSDKPTVQVLTEDQYIINLETLQLHGRLQPVCDSKSQILEDRHIKAVSIFERVETLKIRVFPPQCLLSVRHC